MHWVKISLILCMFGCLKEFRPSESFVTDYLTGPWKNFTDSQVNREIYPVGTYSYFLTLVIIFLITDFVRYKPIIILSGISGVITYLLMILATSVVTLQIVEFFYGLFLSTEVAYYTYIYAKVDKKHYPEVTSHTKAACLIGRCMAGIIAQLTASFYILNFHQLNYLTLSAFIIATVWSLFLPSVEQSIYFHASPSVYNQNIDSIEISNMEVSQFGNSLETISSYQRELYNSTYTEENISSWFKIKKAFKLLWRHVVVAYTNSHVLKWSIWWAFATCGYLQIISYIQLIWQTAVAPGDMIYNGAVDAAYAIIGTVTVFGISKIPLNWPLVGDGMLSIFSFMEGGLILLCSYNYNIWLLYTAYIIFGVIYHTMATVASFEVAKDISEDSYGLIFGVNVFFALFLQSCLTFIVVDQVDGKIRLQFFIYGCYFIALAVIFLIMAVITIVKYIRNNGHCELWATVVDASMPIKEKTEEKLNEFHSKTDGISSISSDDVVSTT